MPLICAAFFLLTAFYVKAAQSVTVVIDPGHGGVSDDKSETNSGAKYHGLEEKNITLITAQAMYDELSQYGNVNVYLTRDSDTEVSLGERVEYADSVGADVIVSIHYNASADHNFFGSEIFTSAYGRCYGVGHALAEQIMKEWTGEGSIPKDIKTRIGRKGDYYGLIRNGTNFGIPTIILEHGYLDNDRDYLRINNEEAWKRFGVLDATGVAKFYGLEKNVVRESVGPTAEIAEPEDPVMPDETEPYGITLKIDDYNSNKGNVDFTIEANDDESRLMYYGLLTGDVDKDTVFTDLELWDAKDGVQKGSFHIQPGYKGKLTAKVYNVYQLDGISNTVELIPDEEAPDDEADNAVIADEGSETMEEPAEETAADTEESDDGWVIGGDIPAADTSAIANAIEKNTESKVKKSYTGLIAAGLTASVTLAVAVVIALSSSAEKRRKKRGKKKDRDVFDWADEFEKR